MIKNKFTFSLLLILILFNIRIINSQDKIGNISGTIIDKSTGQGIEGADVTVHKLSDSVLVKGISTDKEGKFRIQGVPFGRYFVRISFTGYNTFIISGIVLNPSNTDVTIKTVELSSSSSVTEEILVESEKSNIEFKPDKKVFNVGKGIINQGSSLIDLLREIPSVTVDQDGNISLRGGEGVKILIDGRPFGMEGSNRNYLLQQIPASSVESIELISNPSAKYEAEGSAGILNIILKKNTIDNIGVNGNLSLNIGNGDKYNGLTSIGIKSSKFNIYTNYNYNLNNFLPQGFNDRQNFITNNILDLDFNGKNRMQSHLFKAGIDYFIDKFNTIGFSFNYNNSKNNGNDVTNAIERDINNNIINDYIINQSSNSKNNTLDLNLNYSLRFKNPGQNLTSDITYSRNKENNEDLNYYVYNVPTVNEPPNSKTLQDEINDDFSAQIDYVHPFSKDIKIETGVRSGYKKRDTDYNLYDFDYSSSNYILNTNLSNRFVYNEYVQGIYGIYTHQLGKFGFSLGLRAEHTKSKGELINTNEIFDKNYFDIFPSASISQKITDKNEIQLNYTRRINRPRPRQVNPFISFRGGNNYFKGNPDLNAEYTNSFELSYIHFFPFMTITPTLFFKETKDEIARTRTLMDSVNTIVTFVNYGKTRSYGGELMVNLNPFKFWQINGNISYSKREIDATNLSSRFSNTGSVWTGRVLSTLMLPYDISLAVSYFYSGKRIVAQGYIEPFQSLDASVKKDFFNKKLSITLRVSDILNNNSFKGYFNDISYNEVFERKRDKRTFFLNITYNFGERDKKQQDRKRQRDRENNNDGDMGF
jgi:outer membrane receptor protein involved in Fe transport